MVILKIATSLIVHNSSSQIHSKLFHPFICTSVVGILEITPNHQHSLHALIFCHCIEVFQASCGGTIHFWIFPFPNSCDHVSHLLHFLFSAMIWCHWVFCLQNTSHCANLSCVWHEWTNAQMQSVHVQFSHNQIQWPNSKIFWTQMCPFCHWGSCHFVNRAMLDFQWALFQLVRNQMVPHNWCACCLPWTLSPFPAKCCCISTNVFPLVLLLLSCQCLTFVCLIHLMWIHFNLWTFQLLKFEQTSNDATVPEVLSQWWPLLWQQWHWRQGPIHNLPIAPFSGSFSGSSLHVWGFKICQMLFLVIVPTAGQLKILNLFPSHEGMDLTETCWWHLWHHCRQAQASLSGSDWLCDGWWNSRCTRNSDTVIIVFVCLFVWLVPTSSAVVQLSVFVSVWLQFDWPIQCEFILTFELSHKFIAISEVWTKFKWCIHPCIVNWNSLSVLSPVDKTNLNKIKITCFLSLAAVTFSKFAAFAVCPSFWQFIVHLLVFTNAHSIANQTF